MNRTHWILCGLLAAQIVLLLAVNSPFAGRAPVGRQSLLPELGSLEATRIEIRDAEGNSVALSRGEAGWGIEAADGYPADGVEVDKLLDTLSGLEVGRPVVRSARYHDALEVAADDYQRRLRIWGDPESDPRVELFLGSSPNYRVTHVRLDDADEVYEVRGLGAYDLRADASAWVAKRFLDIPADKVISFRMTNAAGTIEVARSEEGWQLVSPARAARELDADKVESLVGSVSQLWISDPAGRIDETAQGLADPVAVVRIRYTEAGEESAEGEPHEVTLRIGGEADDNKRYAARSGFDFAVLLGSYDAEKITEKKLDDLLVDEKSEG